MRDGCGCLAISKLSCRFYLCSKCSIPYTALINILGFHISLFFSVVVGWNNVHLELSPFYPSDYRKMNIEHRRGVIYRRIHDYWDKFLMPLYALEVPLELPWEGTSFFLVWSQRLNASAMANNDFALEFYYLLLNKFCDFTYITGPHIHLLLIQVL